MAYKLKALSAKGDPKLKDAYAACHTQQQKRQFYYEHFLLDPSVSEKTVLKKDSEQQHDIEDVHDGWFTMEKIAEFKGILPSCEKYQEKCQACVKICPPGSTKTNILQTWGCFNTSTLPEQARPK